MTDHILTDFAQQSLSENTWASQLADKVLATFPNEEIYTCAAGISPSGIVHFGNFRDVVTSYAVMCELKARGKKVRFLFSWDNFDRFRKVPEGVDPSYFKYIGMPLTAVPDPWGSTNSYAEHFQDEFQTSMRELGIQLDYKYQTNEYRSGRYIDKIVHALSKRGEIADILLSFKTEKGNQTKGIEPEIFRSNYYPITLYSRFTGTDKTEILDYNGGTILTYRCLKTDQTETIDFTVDPIVKLPWKVDWAMRWGIENVHFEPGGKDHASPGGSYDVSSVMIRKIFDAKPPIFQGYEFVGVQGIGGKMSGSKGGAVSPGMLLEIYEPSLLKWLYLRRAPQQSFALAFDTEIYRQYDEFDRAITTAVSGIGSPWQAKTLKASGVNEKDRLPSIPFKQAVALGQITHWNSTKLKELLQKLGTNYDEESIDVRLIKARSWLETYNPDQIIQLRENVNDEYLQTMGLCARERVISLRNYLLQDVDSINELEEKVYAIPKNPDLDEKSIKIAQRNFFKDVYELLIGKETGPRLSTFLWAADRQRIIHLLEITS